jgi:hypothetical protein
MKWTYKTFEHTGKCRIDAKPIRMRFVVTLTKGPIPDVLKIERWIRDLCKASKSGRILEEYTEEVWSKFGGVVTGIGSTETHGQIEYEVGE